MGWTSTYKPKSMSVAAFFKKRLNYSHDKQGARKVLECKVIHCNTAYLAIKRTLPDDRCYVYGLVCFLKYYHNDPYYNFSWKEIEEECFPYRYECPECILRQLTDPEAPEYGLSGVSKQSVIQWREFCLQRIQAKKTAGLLPNRIEVGETSE